jgi:DNA invertase Pin-like site-specific DNA recombinase
MLETRYDLTIETSLIESFVGFHLSSILSSAYFSLSRKVCHCITGVWIDGVENRELYSGKRDWHSEESGAERVQLALEWLYQPLKDQIRSGSMDFVTDSIVTGRRFRALAIVDDYSRECPAIEVDTSMGGRRVVSVLERLVADAKIGLFDKVVVHKLDRLARNLRLLLEIEQKLREYGVTITSVKESVDTSAGTGKMVFQMFGMIAEWERESIIERTKSGRLQRYKDGCFAGGNVPFGYTHDKAIRKLVIDEVKARIVRRIYAEYREGKTLYGISEGLNRDKVPGRTKNCKGWRPTAVRDILLNPMYKGTQIVNRHARVSQLDKIDLSKTIQIQVPPTVDEQVWGIAQQRLENNKHVKPNKRGDFLLQGMITCGICGYAYRTDRLSELLQDTIENLRMKEADLSARIRPIEERLTEIAGQKARLADDWVIRHMNHDKFKELRDNLDREEARMRAFKAEIDPAQIADLESTRGVLRFWKDQVKSMVWNTENEDGSMVRLVNKPHQVALRVVGFEDKKVSESLGFPASKRELLDKLQVKLVVFNDRIEVNGLFPIQPINIQLFAFPFQGEGD